MLRVLACGTAASGLRLLIGLRRGGRSLVLGARRVGVVAASAADRGLVGGYFYSGGD